MAAAITIVPFLDKLSRIIINPLIILVFSVAFIMFIWGIVQFINSETSEKDRSDGKNKIVWGLVGMFIMFSAYGIVHLIVTSIGANPETGYLTF